MKSHNLVDTSSILCQIRGRHTVTETDLISLPVRGAAGSGNGNNRSPPGRRGVVRTVVHKLYITPNYTDGSRPGARPPLPPSALSGRRLAFTPVSYTAHGTQVHIHRGATSTQVHTLSTCWGPKGDTHTRQELYGRRGSSYAVHAKGVPLTRAATTAVGPTSLGACGQKSGIGHLLRTCFWFSSRFRSEGVA